MAATTCVVVSAVPAPFMWLWLSISPGITVFPARSTVPTRGNVDRFMRLYTAPCVDHLGSSALTNIDMLGALADWVERGRALAGVQLAEQEAQRRSSPSACPLCEWPLWPRHVRGDASQAASFRCAGSAGPAQSPPASSPRLSHCFGPRGLRPARRSAAFSSRPHRQRVLTTPSSLGVGTAAGLLPVRANTQSTSVLATRLTPGWPGAAAPAVPASESSAETKSVCL